MKTSLSDSGESITLDLHGLSLREADNVCRKVLTEAYYRGRDKIVFIHGSSTSSLQFVNSTIKNQIYDFLQESQIQSMITQVIKLEDSCLIDLQPDFEKDRTKIKFIDLI